jgi:23S rRNA pseudouridine2605 synthase
MGDFAAGLRTNMLKGVELEDGPAKFESFSEIGGEGINRWYQVVVKEGRNREVRRIFESQSLKVSRLLRTRYGTVILPRELRTGRWMELDKTDIDNLAKSVELKPRQGTGLFGMAKRRTEKMAKNHWLHVVVVIYVSNAVMMSNKSSVQAMAIITMAAKPLVLIKALRSSNSWL